MFAVVFARKKLNPFIYHLQKKTSMNFPVSVPLVQEKALEIAQEPNLTDFKTSSG